MPSINVKQTNYIEGEVSWWDIHDLLRRELIRKLRPDGVEGDYYELKDDDTVQGYEFFRGSHGSTGDAVPVDSAWIEKYKAVMFTLDVLKQMGSEECK